MNTDIDNFYREVLERVAHDTDINPYDIIHSNKEEAVDARTILVYILSARQITDKEIASLTGLTRQGVNKLKNSVRYRKSKWSFVSYLQQISNAIATNHS